jgi:hypothetical protein
MALLLHAVKAPTVIERAALCTWWSQSLLGRRLAARGA